MTMLWRGFVTCVFFALSSVSVFAASSTTLPSGHAQQLEQLFAGRQTQGVTPDEYTCDIEREMRSLVAVIELTQHYAESSTSSIHENDRYIQVLEKAAHDKFLSKEARSLARELSVATQKVSELAVCDIELSQKIQQVLESMVSVLGRMKKRDWRNTDERELLYAHHEELSRKLSDLHDQLDCLHLESEALNGTVKSIDKRYGEALKKSRNELVPTFAELVLQPGAEKRKCLVYLISFLVRLTDIFCLSSRSKKAHVRVAQMQLIYPLLNAVLAQESGPVYFYSIFGRVTEYGQRIVSADLAAKKAQPVLWLQAELTVLLLINFTLHIFAYSGAYPLDVSFKLYCFGTVLSLYHHVRMHYAYKKLLKPEQVIEVQEEEVVEQAADQKEFERQGVVA